MVIGNQSSVIGEQEPITDNRSPITDNRSPITDHRSPITGHRSPITDKVLAIVAEQTGYPLDMLELDLDLEADLGVDTVKQAETFLAIRTAFDIPRRDDLSLRSYNTLEKVIGFVREMRPDLVIGEQLSVTGEQEPITDNRSPITNSTGAVKKA
jgi:acyl carrier protein